MEQFNPCLRNFVAMGKSYEKALSSEYILLFFFSFISSPSHAPFLSSCPEHRQRPISPGTDLSELEIISDAGDIFLTLATVCSL